MIKRDQIQKVIINRADDAVGGFAQETTKKDFIDACVSQTTTYADMTQFNLKNELVIHVVTNEKLEDKDQDVRYLFQGVLYQVRRQVQRGIEYYSTLVETPN